jgi:hypothetical protein
MNRTLEDLNIYAYLAPHPMDEFSGVEGDYLEWIPGFLNQDDEEEGVSAIYRDCNIQIYHRIVEITEQHFKCSVKNMWPLLEEVNISSMQVAIDISGLISSGANSLAGYMYDLSNHLKGKYVFNLDLNLLITYLKKDEKDIPLEFHEKSVWDHELIHLLDHKSITAASLYNRSRSPFENFKYYLIKYREEGIADLYYLLNGYTKINSLQEAIEKFKSACINRKEEFDFSVPSNYKSREALYEGRHFYILGPWLILEYLIDYESNFEEDKIANCINLIINKEAIPLETILDVIKKAIKIKPEDFLYYIEKHFEKDFIPLI